MYSERQRPDLNDEYKSLSPARCETQSHQKLTGLYLFATIWTIKHVSFSGLAKTDAVPSLKCEERYCKVEVSRANLRKKKKNIIITVSCAQEQMAYRKGSDASLGSWACGSEVSYRTIKTGGEGESEIIEGVPKSSDQKGSLSLTSDLKSVPPPLVSGLLYSR